MSKGLSICVFHRLAIILFIRDRHRFRPQGERRDRWDRCVGTGSLYRCPTCALATFDYGISMAARRHSGKRAIRERGTGGAEGIAALIAVPNRPPSFQPDVTKLDEIFQGFRHEAFPTYTFIAGGREWGVL